MSLKDLRLKEDFGRVKEKRQKRGLKKCDFKKRFRLIRVWKVATFVKCFNASLDCYVRCWNTNVVCFRNLAWLCLTDRL